MKPFNTQFATQKLRENEHTEVTVTGIDAITGLESWDSTIESLIRSGWDLEPKDIKAIENGEAVKLISPNGRRRISVSLKKTDYIEESTTGGTAAINPSTVNTPAVQDWYTTKNPDEKKDRETRLAGRKKAKVYMKDKWGWKDAPSIPNRPSKMFDYKQLFEELNENYSKFRNETRTKTNEQQFHAAVRLAEKKIREANRILEYTAQLKSELSVIKENKNTQKLMERITMGIAKAYKKMRDLK